MSELEPTLTYSNPTATDELCLLLDERGVEYVLDEEYGKKYPPEQSVTWSCDLAGEDMTVTARDYFIGDGEYCLDLEFHEVFTPAQAIAATLGAGTCKNRFPAEMGKNRGRICPTCGCIVFEDEECCPDCNAEVDG